MRHPLVPNCKKFFPGCCVLAFWGAATVFCADQSVGWSVKVAFPRAGAAGANGQEKGAAAAAAAADAPAAVPAAVQGAGPCPTPFRAVPGGTDQHATLAAAYPAVAGQHLHAPAMAVSCASLQALELKIRDGGWEWTCTQCRALLQACPRKTSSELHLRNRAVLSMLLLQGRLRGGEFKGIEAGDQKRLFSRWPYSMHVWNLFSR